MVLHSSGQLLAEPKWPRPEIASRQVLVHVQACAVCRTDLHVIDGELPKPKSLLIPGHEIVGRVVEASPDAHRFVSGDRIGIPWLGWACGQCRYCESGKENLCNRARFTGYTLDGGYAEYVAADERFCFPLPEIYSDAEAAPLLCAGLIGYRSLAKTGDAVRVGLYGFGAAAHLVAQVAFYQRRKVFAFTRPGDFEGQRFALSLGAVWAGDSTQTPPEELDAAIIFAPIGNLVVLALKTIARGGIIVCAGIHMTDIPSFPYELLWQERTLCSVANLTRRDAEEFFSLAPRIPVRTTIQTFPLDKVNAALAHLRSGKLRGAAVLLNTSTGGKK